MFVLGFSGCTIIENVEKKIGLKNDYFEYLNSSDIEQISIQSTRDTGFKFIVTETSAIRDIYNILSRAKISENKSSLDPDYKFEFDLGDEVKEFYMLDEDIDELLKQGHLLDEEAIPTYDDRGMPIPDIARMKIAEDKRLLKRHNG